jgi:hypothetical protein
MNLKQDPEDLEIVTLTTGSGEELHLGAHWGTEYLRRECSIYAPYWTVNSTGKRIHYVVSFGDFVGVCFVCFVLLGEFWSIFGLLNLLETRK